MGSKRELPIFLGTAGKLPVYADPASGVLKGGTPWEGGRAARPPLTGVFVDGGEARSAEATAHAPELSPDFALEAPVQQGGRGAALFHPTFAPALRLGNDAQLAAPHAGHAWRAGAEPLVAGLDAATQRLLGDAWLTAALEEHAGVGRFARLALTLLGFGASSDLVARTEQAASDEVEHARLCFALASTYLATPVGPGPLPGAPITHPDTVELAMSSWRDGCLGKGAKAAIARAARRRAHDPAVCAALTIISRDEATHAELAWDVLGFCLDRGGRTVADALREEVARTPKAPEDPPEDDLHGALAPLLAEHGRLSAADRARCAAETTRTAVRRAGWLLAPSRPGAHTT
jgi:hypothetical protein